MGNIKTGYLIAEKLILLDHKSNNYQMTTRTGDSMLQCKRTFGLWDIDKSFLVIPHEGEYLEPIDFANLIFGKDESGNEWEYYKKNKLFVTTQYYKDEILEEMEDNNNVNSEYNFIGLEMQEVLMSEKFPGLFISVYYDMLGLQTILMFHIKDNSLIKRVIVPEFEERTYSTEEYQELINRCESIKKPKPSKKAKYIYLGGYNILREIENFSLIQDDSLPVIKENYGLYSSQFRNEESGGYLQNRILPNEEDNICESLLLYPVIKNEMDPAFSLIIENCKYIPEEIFESEHTIAFYCIGAMETTIFLLIKNPEFLIRLPFVYVQDEKEFLSSMGLNFFDNYPETEEEINDRNSFIVRELFKKFIIKL